MKKDKLKKYIRAQIEALPYIIAALLLCGILWFVVSMLILLCEGR